MGVVQLKTDLRLFEAITIIVGSMIGSGILRLPGNMLVELHSPSLVLIAWLVGAFLTIMGALTFAELSSMYPRQGGQYHFLKEGLGPFWSYTFGWTMFWVIMSGIVASVSLAFADFLGGAIPGGLPGHTTPLVVNGWDTGIDLPAWGNAFVAIGLIMLLAGLNFLATKYGGVISNITTVGKYLGLLALVAFILVAGDPPADAFEPFLPTDQSGQGLIVAFGAAMALTLFAFDGWPQATYVAGEIRNPKKNLPRALILGPLITAVIYIALTFAYFYVVPLGQGVAIGNDAEGRIAVDAARSAVGEWGATFITIVALVSLFGTVNAYVLTSPRIFYAMAQDGALLKGMARLHEKRATPAYALLIFALWSSFIVMSGVFVQIVRMVVYGLWLFYIPTAIAHMRLRKTAAHLERPFRTPFYPIVPLLFLAAALFVVYVSWASEATLVPSIAATVIMLTGIPFYYFQQRKGTRAGNVETPAPTLLPGEESRPTPVVE